MVVVLRAIVPASISSIAEAVPPHRRLGPHAHRCPRLLTDLAGGLASPPLPHPGGSWSATLAADRFCPGGYRLPQRRWLPLIHLPQIGR